MNEETAAGPRQEGEPAFTTEATSEETEAASQAGDDNQEGDTQSAEGDNTRTEDEKPFHEHPRWLERESEWNKRFNEQETRHQDDLKTIREEFGTARKENATQTKPPVWFGGTQEQWDAYRADRDAELTAAEDRAEKRALDKLESRGKEEGKAVEEATTFLRSEIKAIEGDKALNPSGGKIDAEKLFKVVFDNQLVDTQGRWNYRAGWRLLNGTAQAPKPKPATTEKKEVAAATTSESRGETKPKAYMTSSDFKKDRPW